MDRPPGGLMDDRERGSQAPARRRAASGVTAHLPLADIRVIDLTVARAGPTCVRQLADWGADVIRVEPPAGLAAPGLAADSRHGCDFQHLHRNKRSLSLNLKAPEAHDVLMRLVDTADVLIENMRPPVKSRLGFDFGTVHARNPRLVYGSISGFGQDGPYAGRGGVDQIAQGMGGPMGCFASADGYVNIGASSGRLLQNLCEVIGLPGLPGDPRFGTAVKRSANRAELNALIAERLRTRTTAAWVEELNRAGVPCGPVYRMDEVFADPQVEHLAMTEPVEHPALGRLDILRNAVRMTGAPATVRAPSPDAGDHTADVLAELGYPPAEIDRLRARGVI
jgi:crotonobetainyl-CoA:carnitine CoA-transferase CaiB-like acyl-CoA transferase